MNYLILTDSLILNHEGNTTVINRADGRYDKIIPLLREEKFVDIIPLLDITKDLKDKGFDVRHGLVYLDDEALPDALSKRVLDFYDNNLPFQPLLKFWRKLRNNPSFNSRQMLFKFLEHNGHPITTEGNFIAYRAVRSDFKDKHTGTMDNSIGSVVLIPRSQVDDNPNNTCSYGLHVATMSYAQGQFAGQGDVVLDVEVDPADVVAVPTDYDGTKMRVCKFKVVAVTQGMISKPLVTSAYSDVWDEAFEDTEDLCKTCGETVDKNTQYYCPTCGDIL